MMIIFTVEVHSILLHTNYVTFDSITNKEQIIMIFLCSSWDQTICAVVPCRINDDRDTLCPSSNINSFIKKIVFQVKTEMSWRSGELVVRMVVVVAVIILMMASLAQSKEVEARTDLESVSSQSVRVGSQASPTELS